MKLNERSELTMLLIGFYNINNSSEGNWLIRSKTFPAIAQILYERLIKYSETVTILRVLREIQSDLKNILHNDARTTHIENKIIGTLWYYFRLSLTLWTYDVDYSPIQKKTKDSSIIQTIPYNTNMKISDRSIKCSKVPTRMRNQIFLNKIQTWNPLWISPTKSIISLYLSSD
jgi:hypothetical protein